MGRVKLSNVQNIPVTAPMREGSLDVVNDRET